MPNLLSVVPGADAPSSGDGPHYDEDFNALNENSEEIVEEIKVEDEEESVAKEETEEEVKDEEKTEEEPVAIPFDRPSIKDINTKFPGFFKEFPQLKDAIFREARFTSFFPTVEDAEEAFKDNEAFATLSDSALSGDSAPFIDSIFKTDTKAGLGFSTSFLPNLYKKDQEAYSTVVTPLFENFFRQAYKSSDENIKNSALNLAQFLFGDDGEDSVTGKRSISKIPQLTEDAKKAVEQKEISNTTAFRASATNVSQSVEKAMIAIVSKDFDPDEVFTKVVREMLIKDIVGKIDAQLTHAKDHIAVMSARWKRARANGYTKDDESKLTAAYLARAKSLIPSVREKVRLEALGKKVLPAVKKEVNGGAVSRSNGRQLEKRDYSKMTDREILDS